MLRDLQIEKFHTKTKELSYFGGSRQLVFADRSDETREWVEKRRNKTGSPVYFLSEIERTLNDESGGTESMGRLLVAPSSAGKTYIVGKYQHAKAVKVLDFDDLFEKEVGWKKINWRLRSGQKRLENFVVKLIDRLANVTEKTTIVGAFEITQIIKDAVERTGISFLCYVPSVAYHKKLFDTKLRVLEKKEEKYYGPTWEEILTSRVKMESACRGFTRVIRSNMTRYVLRNDNVRKTYWLIFHLTGRISMSDNIVLILSYFDPLLVSMLVRLGFETCAPADSEEADYVNVIFSGPTVKYPAKYQGLFELDDYSSYPLASGGLGTLIASSVFFDIKLADVEYQATPERYFGRLMRNAIWRYCEEKRHHLITLGSESESFALNKYYKVATTHFSIDEVPEDMKIVEQGRHIKYYRTDDFMLDARVKIALKQKRSLLLGLFSISNTRNPHPRESVAMFAKQTSKFIFSFPNRNVLFNWPASLNGVWRYGIQMKQTSFKNSYLDWSARPEEFLNIEYAVVITARDLLSLLKCDVFGNSLSERVRLSIDVNDPFFYLWFFVIGKELLPVKVQTWFNSQTNFARYVSIPLRNILRLKENTLHVLRAQVFAMLYEEYSPVMIDSLRVNGSYTKNGKVYYVAVSGHLVNLLLYSTSGLIDFRRYFDTIESNVRFSSRIKPSSTESFYLKNDLLAEDNSDTKVTDLWHTYDDYYSAVGTYMYMCKRLKYGINLRAVVYSLRRLSMMRSKYWKFSTASSDAEEYIREEKSAGP